MKLLFSILFFTSIYIGNFAQDVGVVGSGAPNSGCMLSSSETVSVTIYNFGPTTSSPIAISYTINGGTPVTEPYPLASFNTTSSYTHTFSTPADLSINGSYTIKYYTTISGDANNSNDTLISVIVSDALSVGGTINSDFSVCDGNNSGQLDLIGNVGDSLVWEESVNGGGTWTMVSSGSSSYGYNNLSVQSQYRVAVKNGYCAEDYSSITTISIDPISVGGVLSGPDTVCVPPNLGSINLTGETGLVQFWESSTDGGATWSNIANTSSTISFTDLTLTTLYRANIQSGTCLSVYSDTLQVFVKPGAVGGTLSPSTSNVCVSGNSGTISLMGQSNGVIDHWEFSADGGSTWNNLGITTSSYAYSNLLMTTQYRVIIQGCNTDTSTVAEVIVDPISVGGTLSGDATVCQGNNTGVINLTGVTGTVSDWEYSINGGLTWSSLGENGLSYNYTDLSDTTLFRTIVGGSSCPSDTSSVVTILINTPSEAGLLSGPTNVCEIGNSGVVSSGVINGTIQDWSFSINNGISWTSLANNSANQPFVNISQSTSYLFEVKNGVCPSDSAIWDVTVDVVSNAGVLSGDTTVCLYASGTINLSGSVATSILWKSSSDSISWPALQSDSLFYDFQDISNTTYYIAIATNGSCPSDSSNVVKVNVFEYNYGVSPDTLIDFAASVDITAYGGIQYLWSPIDYLSVENEQTTTATPPASMYFSVVITDSNSCIYSDSVEVLVGPQGELLMANIVTRNNDGYNDTWNILGLSKFPLTQVAIFNINGMLVYESQDYQNDWKGTFNGNPLPDGTYYYMVTNDALVLPLRGSLTLISE